MFQFIQLNSKQVSYYERYLYDKFMQTENTL